MRLFQFAAGLALVAFAGCLDCQPLLEVRNCLERQCEPSPDAIEVTWTSQHAAAWPDIDRLMADAELGTHLHVGWDRDNETGLWQAFGMPADADEPELIILHDDARYRIRVLTCD